MEFFTTRPELFFSSEFGIKMAVPSTKLNTHE